MKKVLVVETNVTHYGNTDDPTGLWLGETAEFVDEMQKEGIGVDYVSPKGGFVPLDPRSMKYVDPSIMKLYETPDFQQRALVKTLSPAEVNPDDYSAIYYAGGHGVMWDFPDDPDLQKIAMRIEANNGFVTSVCHGVAGLLNLKNADGSYYIAGKTLTGFTKAEEILAGKQTVVPFYNKAEAEKRGANFKQVRAYKDYAVQDGHLITGQNPFSARSVAKLLVKNLNQD